MVDADTLLPNARLQELVYEGDVTQIHRAEQYADEGETFSIHGMDFEIVEIRERTLGDIDDEDARKEGAQNLAHYKDRVRRAHGTGSWDDDFEVVLHRFEQASG